MKKTILYLLFLSSVIILPAVNVKIKTLKKGFKNSIDTIQINKDKTKKKYVKCYGAIGDGIADDTKAIQRALDDGNGIVVLEKKHKIKASLVNRNNNIVTYLGIGKSELIPSSNSFYKFRSTSNFTLKNIKTTAPFLALEKTSLSYDKLKIENCDISGEKNGKMIPTLYNYAIKSFGNYMIKDIVIKNSNFESTVGYYMSSDFKGNIENLYFINNNVKNLLRYLIAPIKVKTLHFKDNIINGNIREKHTRVIFRTGTKTNIIQNNLFKNIISDGTASVVYSSSGDMYFQNNVIENVSGNSNSHIISDKSSSVVHWVIHDNIFDQTLVNNQKLKAIIKAGNNKVDISNNTFIKPKMTCIQYGSTSGKPTKDNLIAKNRFFAVEQVVVIHLLGNLEDIIIRENTLEGMTNPLGRVSSFDKRCRFIHLMNTVADNTLKNITISNNIIHNITEDGSLFFSNTYKGGGIYNLKFLNNTMTSGGVMLRYRNIVKYPIHSLEVMSNNLTSKILIEETPNAFSRISNNLIIPKK